MGAGRVAQPIGRASGLLAAAELGWLIRRQRVPQGDASSWAGKPQGETADFLK